MTDGRAHLLPYELGVHNYHKGFLYGLSFSGNEIAQDDEYLQDPQKRENRTNQLNAGSKKFYAINPKLMNLSGWLGYRVHRNIIITGKIMSAVNGSNSAKGNTYSLNVKWRVLSSHSKQKKKSSLEKEFKLDGVD